MATRNISHLPDELWLVILEQCRYQDTTRNSCEILVILGNLAMTNRRLRSLALPMVCKQLSCLLAEEEKPDRSSEYIPTLAVHLLLELLHTIRQCPMLACYVHELPTSLTVLNRRYARGYHGTNSLNGPFYGSTRQCRQHQRFGELRPFGQKALRSFGISDKMHEWHSFDGWIALLLLMLPSLERLTWTGDGVVDLSSPLRRMVDIAKAQKPPRSFRALTTVSLACPLANVPDALIWDFLVLPSVEDITGPAAAPSLGLADRLHMPPDSRRLTITTFQSGRPLPVHLLEEKFRLLPNLRSFHYRYSLHHNGGFLQMMALTHALRQLRRSLEEITIEPLPLRSPLARSRASRTSPHMWRRLSGESQLGTIEDASWLLGPLTAFDRLRVVRVPRSALYDPRFVVSLKQLLPRSLMHLDVSPGPAPHKLDAAMLSTQLVIMVRSKPERYPRLHKLTLGDHVVLFTPLLRDVCAKFKVEVDVGTESDPQGSGVREAMDVPDSE